MQKLSIIGNLGGDPEVRYTPNGKQVANFRVAVSSGRSDPQTGEKITVWYKATCWENKAELAAQYLRKGSKVYLEGEPGIDQWDDRNSGEVRTNLTINVGFMEFLSPRPTDEGGAQRQSPSQRSVPRDDLDDLPF